MNGTERIEFARWLLERLEIHRHHPNIGHIVAARWASGAFAQALMAHSGQDDVETEMPDSMYPAVARLDWEDGGERWRQTAFAAYELSHHFYFGGLPGDELERKTAEVVQGTLDLLARLDVDPGGEGKPGTGPQ